MATAHPIRVNSASSPQRGGRRPGVAPIRLPATNPSAAAVAALRLVQLAHPSNFVHSHSAAAAAAAGGDGPDGAQAAAAQPPTAPAGPARPSEESAERRRSQRRSSRRASSAGPSLSAAEVEALEPLLRDFRASSRRLIRHCVACDRTGIVRNHQWVELAAIVSEAELAAIVSEAELAEASAAAGAAFDTRPTHVELTQQALRSVRMLMAFVYGAAVRTDAAADVLRLAAKACVRSVRELSENPESPVSVGKFADDWAHLTRTVNSQVASYLKYGIIMTESERLRRKLHPPHVQHSQTSGVTVGGRRPSTRWGHRRGLISPASVNRNPPTCSSSSASRRTPVTGEEDPDATLCKDRQARPPIPGVLFVPEADLQADGVVGDRSSSPPNVISNLPPGGVVDENAVTDLDPASQQYIARTQYLAYLERNATPQYTHAVSRPHYDSPVRRGSRSGRARLNLGYPANSDRVGGSSRAAGCLCEVAENALQSPDSVRRQDQPQNWPSAQHLGPQNQNSTGRESGNDINATSRPPKNQTGTADHQPSTTESTRIIQSTGGSAPSVLPTSARRLSSERAGRAVQTRFPVFQALSESSQAVGGKRFYKEQLGVWTRFSKIGLRYSKSQQLKSKRERRVSATFQTSAALDHNGAIGLLKSDSGKPRSTRLPPEVKAYMGRKPLPPTPDDPRTATDGPSEGGRAQATMRSAGPASSSSPSSPAPLKSPLPTPSSASDSLAGAFAAAERAAEDAMKPGSPVRYSITFGTDGVPPADFQSSILTPTSLGPGSPAGNPPGRSPDESGGPVVESQISNAAPGASPRELPLDPPGVSPQGWAALPRESHTPASADDVRRPWGVGPRRLRRRRTFSVAKREPAAGPLSKRGGLTVYVHQAHVRPFRTQAGTPTRLSIPSPDRRSESEGTAEGLVSFLSLRLSAPLSATAPSLSAPSESTPTQNGGVEFAGISSKRRGSRDAAEQSTSTAHHFLKLNGLEPLRSTFSSWRSANGVRTDALNNSRRLKTPTKLKDLMNCAACSGGIWLFEKRLHCKDCGMTVHVDCVQYLKVPFHGCKAYFSRNRQRRDVRPKATSASASVPATIPMLPIGDAPAASVFGDFIALLNGELTSQDGGEEGGDEAGEGAGDGAAGSSALTGTPTGAGAGSRSAGSGASRLRGRSPVADSDIRKPAVPAPSATEATDCAGGDFQTTATAIPTPGAAASPALTGAGKLPISAPEGNAAACVHAAAASDPSPKATAARDGSSGYHAVSLAHSVSTHSFWGDEDEDRQAAPAGSGIDGLVLVSATAAASSRAE